MIVYYRTDKNPCIFNTWDCYACPVKKCVTYSDGVRRIECDNELLNALKKRKDIKILSIKEV